MKEILLQHGIEAFTTIIVTLVGVLVSSLRKEFKGFGEKIGKVEEHLGNINGQINQMKLDEAKCQGEMDVELTKRPNFQQTRDIVKEHGEGCSARNKA